LGLFTTLRVRTGEILFWPEHVGRLRAGAPDLDAEALLEAVGAAVGDLVDARVRITVGPPGPPKIEARAYVPPTAPWRIAPVVVSLAGDGPLPKTTDRARYEEAGGRAGDADDALLVGPSGEVLETTIANVVFLLPGGRLVTPPARGILPGIARAGLSDVVRETSIRLEEITSATACVVTNALLLAYPVRCIDGSCDLDSDGLARDLREVLLRKGPRIRIIQP
jgi:branched-subunit amino acid aminotransferase/4-amino-4-deoxychorismate lyase